MKHILLSLFIAIGTLASAQKNNLAKFGIDEQAYIPTGLSVGDTAINFRGIDQNGNKFVLSEALKNGPVIVVFYRGVWCGICSRHLMALEEDLNLLTKKGAQVVAISPEVEMLRDATAEKTKVSFSLLSDGDGKIMEQYDVAFTVTDDYVKKVKAYADMELSENHNQDIAKLPIPATYIIGTDGVIKHASFNPDYGKRSTVEELVKQL